MTPVQRMKLEEVFDWIKEERINCENVVDKQARDLHNETYESDDNIVGEKLGDSDILLDINIHT